MFPASDRQSLECDLIKALQKKNLFLVNSQLPFNQIIGSAYGLNCMIQLASTGSPFSVL